MTVKELIKHLKSLKLQNAEVGVGIKGSEDDILGDFYQVTGFWATEEDIPNDDNPAVYIKIDFDIDSAYARRAKYL